MMSLVPNRLLAAAPLRVWQEGVAGPETCNFPMARHDFRGVAVVVHEIRCSKSLGREHGNDTAHPMQRPSGLGDGRLPLTSHKDISRAQALFGGSAGT
jgi:hypothetical protein